MVISASVGIKGTGLLIVPPFIKYHAGPLLGPALLQAAATASGHECSILDLNALWISKQLLQLQGQRQKILSSSSEVTDASGIRGNNNMSNGSNSNSSISNKRSVLFQGDHNKPADNSLSRVERMWNNTVRGYDTSKLKTAVDDDDALLRRIQFGFLDHDEIQSYAKKLATSSFGTWTKQYLQTEQQQQQQRVNLADLSSSTSSLPTIRRSPPQVVGLSLLHAGQVLPATVISNLVREYWPDSVIVWGGPHITGLGDAIQEDIHIRKEITCVDLFVQGHAEETFVNLLDQAQAQHQQLKQQWQYSKPSQKNLILVEGNNNKITAVAQGSRGKFLECPAIPSFKDDDLGSYSQPLTLPVQSSLGCAYGRCAFCTYPAMEGKPVKLSLNEVVEPILYQALELGPDRCSGISFKDSLVTTKRLLDISDCIDGRVSWSACTKLNKRLANRDIFESLRLGGLVTLEVGLESLLPETQRRVGKIQPQSLFETFVSEITYATSSTSSSLVNSANGNGNDCNNISLVVNYMTGFPWEDYEESHSKLEEVRQIIAHHLGHDRGKVEHNVFELERLSPMARSPEKYDIDKGKLQTWPWASVIEQLL